MTWPKPLAPGDRAPDFELPTVDRDGMIALSDYRGRSALMIGLFRGLFCPFCRRQIAQLGASMDKLRQEGVETVGVLITPVGRGRLYYRYHPAPIPLASDETGATHRAFGVPRFEVISESEGSEAAAWPHTVTEEQINAVRVNPGGIFPEPLPPDEGGMRLNRAEGFQPTPEDMQTMEQHWNQLDGLFLIDQEGVVRWRYLEAVNDPSDLGSFPSEQEMLAAVRALRQ
jgi:peroxiredoxin